MMSRAEQDIDSDRDQVCEAVVKDRDITDRFLKQAHSFMGTMPA
jgi:hypothetical protein